MQSDRHLKILKTSLLAAGATACLGMASGAQAALTTTTVAAATPVKVSIGLPLRNTAAMKTLLVALHTKGSPSYHQWLTRDQIAAQFGPTDATFAAAEAPFLKAGLQVTKTSPIGFDVSGPASKMGAALGVSIRATAASNGGQRFVSLKPAVLPAATAAAGGIVATLAPVPERRLHAVNIGAVPANRNGPAGGYNYNDLKQAYDYPSYQSTSPATGAPLDGTGVNVAIIMEDLAQNSDVAAMFDHESFSVTTGKADPTFSVVPINGGGYYGGGGTFEASLDVQQVLGGAPGANVTLLSLPSLSDFNIISALGNVITTNLYDVVSMSFGGCESLYTPDYNNGYDYTGVLAYEDEFFFFGALEGVSFIASSGDSGGLACPSLNYFVGGANPHFVPSVEGPADDPFVTAVGGGNLITVTGNGLDSTYVSENDVGNPEVPWNIYGLGNVSGGWWGAGGGVSKVFAAPPWQNSAYTGTLARAVPDVGMLVGGCPGGLLLGACNRNTNSFVVVTVSGGRYGLIGTSVAAPEFAGATALLVEYYGGRQGVLGPGLYDAGQTQVAAGGANAPSGLQFFHMNIAGFDGYNHQTANGGYNFINGNGTPDVRVLFGMTSLAPAGVPRTASNP